MSKNLANADPLRHRTTANSSTAYFCSDFRNRVYVTIHMYGVNVYFLRFIPSIPKNVHNLLQKLKFLRKCRRKITNKGYNRLDQKLYGCMRRSKKNTRTQGNRKNKE